MCFGLNFSEIFKDTFFQEHLRTTASEIRRVSFAEHNSRILQLFVWRSKDFILLLFVSSLCVESYLWFPSDAIAFIKASLISFFLIAWYIMIRNILFNHDGFDNLSHCKWPFYFTKKVWIIRM